MSITKIVFPPLSFSQKSFLSIFVPSTIQEGFAFAHCTECRAKFILRANVPPDRWWLRLKFQFLVARDHAIIFVIVQLVTTCFFPAKLLLCHLLDIVLCLTKSCNLITHKGHIGNMCNLHSLLLFFVVTL